MAIQTVEDPQFEETLQENEKVIVRYYADWCGSCKLFTPKYRRLSEDERFEDVVFLDVNAEKNEKARKKVNVDNLPFFATFSNGELKEATSTTKEDQVVDMLNGLN